MAPSIPTEWPSAITAGNTVKVSRFFPDFIAPTWALNVFVNGINILGPIAAAQSGTGFLVTLTAAQTASLGPGGYTIGEVVTDGTDTYTAATSNVTVLPNFATAVAGSFQAWAEKTLVAIEGVITGRITDDIAQYQIGNRMVTKIAIDELMRIRSTLKSELRAKSAGAGTFGAQVNVEFGGIS
jgi:hypothetical protein